MGFPNIFENAALRGRSRRRGRRGNLDLNDEDEDMEYEIFEVPVYPPNCKPRREQPDYDETTVVGLVVIRPAREDLDNSELAR